MFEKTLEKTERERETQRDIENNGREKDACTYVYIYILRSIIYILSIDNDVQVYSRRARACLCAGIAIHMCVSN